MPSKLAIIEIETGEDERLCGVARKGRGGEKFQCPWLSCSGEYCDAFKVPTGRQNGKPMRVSQCLESTRLASLDRAVVEAAEKFSTDWSDFDGTDSEQTLLALHEAVKERRDANG